MKDFLAPLRRVRTQLQYGRSFRSFEAKLSVSSGRRLKAPKTELQSHRAVFTAENYLGSLQQRFPSRFLLAKRHYTIRFIAHNVSHS